MNIKAKITLALLLVTLIPLLSFGLAIYIYNQSQTERVAAISNAQAHSVLNAVEHDIENAISEVRTWASVSNISNVARKASSVSRSTLEKRWRENDYLYASSAMFLKNISQIKNRRFKEIFFTDARGYVLSSTNATTDFGQGPEDDPPNGEPWWTEARRTGLRFGDLSFDDSAGVYSVDISVAITDEEGFAGVLKAVYDVEALLDLIGQAHVGRGGHAVLVDAGGNIIAAPKRFRSSILNDSTSLAKTEIARTIRNHKEGHSVEDIPWVGKAFVSVAPGNNYRFIGQKGWSALLIVPIEDAMISANQVKRIGGAAMITVLLAVAIFTFLISRRLSKPLLDISASVAKIDGGNLNIRVPHDTGRDEIGSLARNINRMTERLEAFEKLNIEKIQQLNADLEIANQELSQLASKDSLTGLWNVRMFRERLDQELKRCRRSNSPMTLILIDIDHFKSVNDRYGHPVGDAVLKQIAQVLKDGLRQTDFAARYGGEELVVILPDTDGANGRKLAEKLRKLIELEEITTQHHDLKVTASFGLAEFHPEGSETPDRLVSIADQALYHAKANGRNRVEMGSNVNEA